MKCIICSKDVPDDDESSDEEVERIVEEKVTDPEIIGVSCCVECLHPMIIDKYTTEEIMSRFKEQARIYTENGTISEYKKKVIE